MRSLLLALALARIIAGETPTCDTPAKVAVAQVYANREQAGIVGGWYGDADPTATDLAVALTWQTWPDLVDGAIYAIGYGDRERVEASGNNWLAGTEVTGRWQCGGPYFVETVAVLEK